MDLTPEQIDRQPFRMRKRGYDIMQVRNFLREVAQEMRTRQERRDDRRPPTDDAIAEAEARAARIVADAEAEAQALVENAETAARMRSDEVLIETQARLDELLAEERDAHHRLQELVEELEGATETADGDVIELSPQQEAAPTDSSLADFMKAALRNEIRQN